jgi:chromosome segregation ATPase
MTDIPHHRRSPLDHGRDAPVILEEKLDRYLKDNSRVYPILAKDGTLKGTVTVTPGLDYDPEMSDVRPKKAPQDAPDLSDEALDALIQLIRHNLQWSGLQDVDREAYEQAADTIAALRAQLASLQSDAVAARKRVQELVDDAKSNSDRTEEMFLAYEDHLNAMESDLNESRAQMEADLDEARAQLVQREGVIRAQNYDYERACSERDEARAQLAREREAAGLLVHALVDAVWAEYLDSITSEWVFRRDHVDNAIRRALAAYRAAQEGGG